MRGVTKIDVKYCLPQENLCPQWKSSTLFAVDLLNGNTVSEQSSSFFG